MLEHVVMIQCQNGLHARPASQLVSQSTHFEANLTLCKGDKEVDMKSILGILSLSVDFGDLVMIKAIGADEEQAMTNLIRFFNELS